MPCQVPVGATVAWLVLQLGSWSPLQRVQGNCQTFQHRVTFLYISRNYDEIYLHRRSEAGMDLWSWQEVQGTCRGRSTSYGLLLLRG